MTASSGQPVCSLSVTLPRRRRAEFGWRDGKPTYWASPTMPLCETIYRGWDSHLLYRSSDYGTTYTKLNLMPGTTIIVTNFYICPTNKKKSFFGRMCWTGPWSAEMCCVFFQEVLLHRSNPCFLASTGWWFRGASDIRSGVLCVGERKGERELCGLLSGGPIRIHGECDLGKLPARPLVAGEMPVRHGHCVVMALQL
ncbi:hypothetical protein SKAU_G00029650 [Synaphobranchus kaupii]|uniref:Uncharacterized protein n=1 Tax=Synaphobranchus kaupii TaxID=118154 RepID=A0A9Q1GFB0_SYNKA|nr:hypothetical protein SKAU_G00029650 [Synaphobranchus kaupii]